ncbi:hypothetical protein [Nesterenkonia alkaliphila]|uniref:Uncharacterized protein n=1 Tax=Nesterenkonia alkaliphila TaxID=1463631 RepID=A0A7K1UGY3_9MICC|nr:hypothetical protein [Nesterenkonia alkaliphila]MVT25699.1 hypothetical protein [Nesterenkonia alkaliphila]GFZ85186.1 hypothetical protein GCM10011359_12870 [Nesterenkonia alkaliphila]
MTVELAKSKATAKPGKFRKLLASIWQEIRSLRVLTWISLLFALPLGVVLVCRGLQLAWDGTETDLLAPGATIVAASIAGAVSSQGVISWKEQRTRDRERSDRELAAKLREQREEDYEAVIRHLQESFLGSFTEHEATVRRRIAVWASADFMERYLYWRDNIKDLTGQGSVPVPVDRRDEILVSLGQLCLAARKDLRIETRVTPTAHDIARVLFDDYGRQ